MEEEFPDQYKSIRERFRQYHDALSSLGKAARGAGPLDEKTGQLIQLAAAAAVRSEGAVHSHTRRALEAGASPAEIYHAVVLVTSTIGFPTVSAAISWIDDLLGKK